MKLIVENRKYKLYESNDPEKLFAILRKGKWELLSYSIKGNKYRMKIKRRKVD